MKKLFTLLALFAFAFTFAACEAQEETLEVDQSTIADAFIVDEFDLSDIELTYTVNEDAQTIVLEEGMLTDDVPNTVGVHTLEVTYENAVTSFDIELVEADDDEDEVKEGQYLQFRYRIEDGEATLTEVMDFEILSVAIPEEIHGAPVTAIGEGALNEHARTHTITIPGSVEYIAEGAFVDTLSLSSIIFEGSVPTLYAYGEDNASFSGLSETVLFYAEEDNVSDLSTALGDYSHRAFDVDDRGSLFFLIYETFDGSAVDYEINYAGDVLEAPDNPTQDEYVFEGWFTSVDYDAFFDFEEEMPSANTTVYAGWYDENLQFETRTVTVDEEEVEYVAITGYDGSIETLNIPNRLYTVPVTEIDANAFENMTDLEYVNIPAYVDFIGAGAFSGSGLVEAVLNQSDPDAIELEDDTVFNGVHEDFELIVPNGAGADYRANDAWVNAVGYENIWTEEELDAANVASVFDAEEGDFVHIEGVVTSFPVFGGNSGFFIQDEDGTAFFVRDDHNVEIGNKVTVAGYVDFRTQHQDGNTVYRLDNTRLTSNDSELNDVFVEDDISIEDVAADFQTYQGQRFYFENVTVESVNEDHNYVMLDTGESDYGIRYDIRNYGPETGSTYFSEGDTIEWIELTISHISHGNIVAEYVTGKDFVELDTAITVD